VASSSKVFRRFRLSYPVPPPEIYEGLVASWLPTVGIHYWKSTSCIGCSLLDSLSQYQHRRKLDRDAFVSSSVDTRAFRSLKNLAVSYCGLPFPWQVATGAGFVSIPLLLELGKRANIQARRGRLANLCHRRSIRWTHDDHEVLTLR
jgi:hypothetical protein